MLMRVHSKIVINSGIKSYAMYTDRNYMYVGEHCVGSNSRNDNSIWSSVHRCDEIVGRKKIGSCSSERI